MKYTEDNVNVFVDCIRTGVMIKQSCQVIGISQETYFTWMKDHPEFADRIKVAQGERVKEALLIIRKAALKYWTAAAWFLERTLPDQYCMKTQVTNVPSWDEEAAKKERAQRLTKRLNEIIEEQVKVGNNGHEPVKKIESDIVL